MVACERLSIGLVRVADERSDARPGAQDVASSHLNVRIQVVLDLVDDEVDVLLGRRRRVGHFARTVRCAGHCVVLPRQEEDHTTVAGVRVEKTHILRTVVVGQHNVDARARLADLLGLGVVHLTDRVRVGSGRVDDALGFDVELFAAVSIEAFGADDRLLAGLVHFVNELGDIDVVGHVGAEARGRQRDADVHAGVVVLTVVVDESALEPVILQHRKGLERSLLVDVVARLEQLLASDKIVRFDARPVVRYLPPPDERQNAF